MDYLALMKQITRQHVERIYPACTGDYTSCACQVCDESRRDHWADQQYQDGKDARDYKEA